MLRQHLAMGPTSGQSRTLRFSLRDSIRWGVEYL
uniref:Uncharacterized protein n=1 Tax=Rhizophora mucronata TaxID=61149 RepID=A0A2P2IRR2_RHIMU